MRREGILDRLAARALGPSESDLADSLELAVSAHTFSRRTTAVVDDKLSFSATLMRAGEVDAARRLLAEVEEEVLIEEAALIERVNEVKVARSMSTEPMTPGRLARTLAVAMVGSSLLAFSAAGMAVVGLFKDNERSVHAAATPGRGIMDASDANAGENNENNARRSKVIAGVRVAMTPAQQKRYEQLQSTGFANEDELQRFLLEVLPTPLAEKIHTALVTGMTYLPKPVRKELKLAANLVVEKHREVSSHGGSPEKKEASPSPSEKPSEEPSSEPSDEPEGGSEREEPSPSPTPEDGTPNVPLVGDGTDG
ncbi:MAG TPA: hypothetical protein VG929_03820 [Actinomycetota bacterium]|nr:hypothetical protein [Actinomycetota bacterium]